MAPRVCSRWSLPDRAGSLLSAFLCVSPPCPGPSRRGRGQLMGCPGTMSPGNGVLLAGNLKRLFAPISALIHAEATGREGSQTARGQAAALVGRSEEMPLALTRPAPGDAGPRLCCVVHVCVRTLPAGLAQHFLPRFPARTPLGLFSVSSFVTFGPWKRPHPQQGVLPPPPPGATQMVSARQSRGPCAVCAGRPVVSGPHAL